MEARSELNTYILVHQAGFANAAISKYDDLLLSVLARISYVSSTALTFSSIFFLEDILVAELHWRKVGINRREITRSRSRLQQPCLRGESDGS